ncbi:MAG TPA: hypothetical protein VMT11_18470 [Myxococcaceae bacterium]|nr:hypothetical protein [Myxococcaceae bacterium]
MSRRLTVPPLVPAALAAVLLLAGCSADPLNIIILNARAPTDKCDFSDSTLYTERGTLDLRPWVDAAGNAGFSDYYFQQFSWENQLQPAPITVNGQVVDPGGGNDFIADTIVYQYQYTDPAVVLANETQNIRAVISAGGSEKDNRMNADLIQPKAAAALNASLTATGQTLLVTFQVFGKLAGGSPKYTNKVSFPLTVYRSSAAPLVCPTGTKLYEGQCGVPGRDATVQCVPST